MAEPKNHFLTPEQQEFFFVLNQTLLQMQCQLAAQNIVRQGEEKVVPYSEKILPTIPEESNLGKWQKYQLYLTEGDPRLYKSKPQRQVDREREILYGPAPWEKK